MTDYICNTPILCTGSIIAVKGGTIKLDEADSHTKALLYKKLISPAKKQAKPKKEK